MKVDLHIHSSYSSDAINSPGEICRAALRKGLDAIALTDHDTTAGWRAMRKAADRAGLLFIPGQEQKVILHDEVVGEVLCLFLHEPVRRHDPAGILCEVQQQEGLIVAVHPFDRRRPALGRSQFPFKDGSIVAIEVINGRSYGRQANRRAAAYAALHGLPVTAGSDAHTPFEVGNVYVEAEVGTLDELKHAILSRRVRVRGRVSHPIFSLYSGMRKLPIASRNRCKRSIGGACLTASSDKGRKASPAFCVDV